MEVCRKDAALVRPRRHQEEVKGTGWIRLLDESPVNDAARGRIHQLAILILDKETLRDTLVHDNQSDQRLLSHFVVDF